MFYRGYEIIIERDDDPTSGRALKWMIHKDGKFVCQQPSEDFAYHWIDGEKAVEHKRDT